MKAIQVIVLNLLRLLHANCLKLTSSETWPSVGHLFKSHRISINMGAAEICRLCSQQDLREAMCNILVTYVSPSLTPAPFSLNFHFRKHFRMFAKPHDSHTPRALECSRSWPAGFGGGEAGTLEPFQLLMHYRQIAPPLTPQIGLFAVD